MSILSNSRLVIVTGKGGVGKSSIAAALALRYARSGERTLVCEVNTKERIAPLLGKSPVGPEIALVEENLWAVDVRPAEAMKEYALMVLKFESIYNAVFENRFVRYFLRFVPSIQELVCLGKILFHLQEEVRGKPRFDRVIIDAPATGHAVTFFSVPQVILATVPPGALSTEAQKMRDLLIDDQLTATVLVSLPEEMPVNETIDLCHALRTKVSLTPCAVVLNGVYPPRFEPTDLGSLQAQPSLSRIAEQHHDRAALTESCRDRLASELRLPIIDVPRLFPALDGRAGVEVIAEHLAPLTGVAA